MENKDEFYFALYGLGLYKKHRVIKYFSTNFPSVLSIYAEIFRRVINEYWELVELVKDSSTTSLFWQRVY